MVSAIERFHCITIFRLFFGKIQLVPSHRASILTSFLKVYNARNHLAVPTRPLILQIGLSQYGHKTDSLTMIENHYNFAIGLN